MKSSLGATIPAAGNNHDARNIAKRFTQGDVSDEELAQLAYLKDGQIGEFREIFRIFDNNGDGFIDQDELKRMVQSLHFDNFLLSDEYYQDLIRKVKGPNVDLESGENLYFSFSELMFSMLQRPKVNYTKREVLKAFSILAGKSNAVGKISEEKLSRALYRGNGGADPLIAEEIMTMVEHNTGGMLDYQEMVDLMMGVKETKPQVVVPIHRVGKKNRVSHNKER